ANPAAAAWARMQWGFRTRSLLHGRASRSVAGRDCRRIRRRRRGAGLEPARTGTRRRQLAGRAADGGVWRGRAAGADRMGAAGMALDFPAALAALGRAP